MFDNYLTIPVELSQPQLTGNFMNEQTINTREFLRNYKKFSTSKQTIIIANHGKPEGVFMPYLEWEQNTKRKSRIITQADIDKYTKGLPGFPPILPHEIDEILYKNYKSYKNKK